MFYPLKFEPIYKNYIWGGNNLRQFGRELPSNIIAESWDVCSHKNGQSVVANGSFKGMTLIQLMLKYSENIIGDHMHPSYLFKFPLLIKLIDARDKLSVQVHPDDRYAFQSEGGEFGKNEAWHILHAEAGAKIIVGLRDGVTKEVLFNAINEKKILECLNEINVHKGDTIYIPAGTVHAIGSGIVIAEIQQNSDLTYRLYDYDRVDACGKERELHIDKAMDVINFPKSVNTIRKGLLVNNDCYNVKYLITNRYFIIEEIDINGEYIHNTEGKRFYIYTIVEGCGEIGNKYGTIRVNVGDSIFVPAGSKNYYLNGTFKTLRFYVPFYKNEIYDMLVEKGFSKDEMIDSISGID